MKGSVIDAMSEAVEGAEVILYGVSEPYKESANCRMEAQYAMQRLELEAMIPLMMERYKASGAHDHFQTTLLLGCIHTDGAVLQAGLA